MTGTRPSGPPRSRAACGLAAALALALLGCAPTAASAGNGTREVKAQFERFCKDWMKKLRTRQSANESALHFRKQANGVAGEFTGYGSEAISCVAKPTGKPAVPYVGRLVYHEIQYQKSGRSASEARSADARELYRIEVTELFRFDGGSWVY